MFNAFKYTKQLEEADFSRAQAEMQLQIITEIVEDDLATKQDLRELKSELMNAMQNHSNVAEIRFNKVESEIRQIENRLTIKLGACFVIGLTAMTTVLKLWVIK